LLRPCRIALYFKEFYEFLLTRLAPGGLFVTQGGPGSVFNANECFACIYKTLGTVFRHVVPYTVDIPSFGSNWGFVLALNSDSPAGASLDAATGSNGTAKFLAAFPPSTFDEALEARGLTRTMRFFDGITATGIFAVPKTVRRICDEEDRIMTKETPVFMTSM
jgi:thermospermine synthase